MSLKNRLSALEQHTAKTAPLVIPEIVTLEDGRIMQNHGGFVLPLPMTPEEWEAKAAKQQAELVRGFYSP